MKPSVFRAQTTSNLPLTPALIMNFFLQLDPFLLPSHFCTNLFSIIDDTSKFQEQKSAFILYCLETLAIRGIFTDYML